MLRVFAAIFVLLVFAASVQCEEEPAKKAPEFSLKDLNNKEVALEDLLGKGPIVVEFWATWCKPCTKGLDHVRDIYKELKEKGLQVVAINEDDPRNVSKVKPLASSHRWDFTILLDTNKDVKRLYQVSGYPTTFVLDSEGSIRYKHYGYTPGSEKDLKNEIEGLLLTSEATPETGSEAPEDDSEDAPGLGSEDDDVETDAEGGAESEEEKAE